MSKGHRSKTESAPPTGQSCYEYQKEQCSHLKCIECMKIHKSKKRKPGKIHLAPLRAALKPTPSFESW